MKRPPRGFLLQPVAPHCDLRAWWRGYCQSRPQETAAWLRTLSPLRQAVLLALAEERTHRAAGRRLGVSHVTVVVHERRALMQLAKRVAAALREDKWRRSPHPRRSFWGTRRSR